MAGCNQSRSSPSRIRARIGRSSANHIREGRFQRSLSLLTAGTSIVSGLEVAYEHYRGSYSRRVMYTPVIMSVRAGIAGFAGFFSRSAARTVLRFVSAVTLADAAVGFYFHVRGIKRKPGGWRLPMTNMIMGPPIFAPLLFGTSAYLGLIASFLQREEASDDIHDQGKTHSSRGCCHRAKAEDCFPRNRIFAKDAFNGRLRSSPASALCSVASKLSIRITKTTFATRRSGLRSSSPRSRRGGVRIGEEPADSPPRRFRRFPSSLPQMPPLASTTMAVACFAGRAARKHLLYNIMYGPPIFAPLLFGAAGMLGVLASLLRRRTQTIERQERAIVDSALLPRDLKPAEPLAPRRAAWLLSRLQHAFAESLLG